jgi:hypothetical protein
MVLHQLLRVSYLASYVKALVVASREPLLAGELPTALVTPAICKGLVRGLAELAAVRRQDLADADVWRRRLDNCNHVQGIHIVVDRERARTELERLASEAGVRWRRVDDVDPGAWADEHPEANRLASALRAFLPPGTGGWEGLAFDLHVAGGPVELRASRTQQAISLTAQLDGARQPARSRRWLRRLLELNREVEVAKLALDDRGRLVLLYQVPEVFPGLFQHLQDQFNGLLAGLRQGH